MGAYNPHAPQILGNEWVPILDPGLLPTEMVENGYSFTIDTGATIVTGSYYIKELPPASSSGIAELMAVYLKGTEDQTGPVRQVIIPCTAVSTTGSGITGVPSVTAAAVTSPSDSNYLQIAPTSGINRIGFSFDVTSYTNELDNKRILDVSVLYTAAGAPLDFGGTSLSYARAATITNGTSGGGTPVGALTIVDNTEINELSLSEVNVFFSAAVVPPVSQQPFSYPWRYEELAFFQPNSAAGTKLIVSWFNQDISEFQFVNYVALRVTYCEEKRLAYGAHRVSSTHPLVQGYRYIPLRDPNYNTTIALASGDYTVVISQTPLSDTPANIPPTLSALEELYELPALNGIQVNRSLVVDSTFTQEYNPVLPALGLHTSAAIVTGTHSYGRQIQTPVYTGINTTQEIELRNAPAVSANYTQVRFYARLMDNATTGALTIVMVAQPGATATITVAEFAALSEIVDGWKEVTLRFATPAALAVAAGVEDFTWTSTNSASGQWQILGASINVLPPPQSPNASTYLAPFGAVDRLIWKEPNDSASGADVTSDVSLLLSQDPPTVTGFTVTGRYQTVASIGLNCGTPNGCIPSGIAYNYVSWGAVPDASLGGFTLQRLDVYDTDWQTIMETESLNVLSFDDYEARVGVQSWYRIRTFNALDFYGSWVTGSGTIPAPGVQITGDGNSVLIFTTNVGPTGNLAYTMMWDSRPIESFVFPEADTVQLQRMFGKNYMTAFRPLERGGERFQRTLLVNAAAIALPSLANFRSLRNLAWTDVPYICVRDELGNRWFATVIVPSGDVQVNRQIYLAQIDVVETNDTPYPVDPSL